MGITTACGNEFNNFNYIVCEAFSFACSLTTINQLHQISILYESGKQFSAPILSIYLLCKPLVMFTIGCLFSKKPTAFTKMILDK